MKLTGWKLQATRIAALIFVVAVTALLVMYRNQVSQLGVYGYPGIFILSMLTNATLILPLPGVMIASAMGAVFNPVGVAVAAGLGAAVGELSGYLAGYSGQGVASRTPGYARVEGWIHRYGEWAIFFLAVIPNPLFDLAGMVAGVTRIPLWRFLLWCALGKIIKMLFFAFGGAAGGSLFP